MAAVLHTFAAGGHVIAPVDLFHGTARLLQEYADDWSMETTFIDSVDAAAFDQAIRPNTKLILIESPTNPMLRITDLAAVARVAHSRGVLVVADNTWTTAFVQRPIELGCDFTVYSTTIFSI